MQIKRNFLLALAAIVSTQTGGLAQTVTSFNPAQGQVGQQVTVNGTGFVPGSTTVRFNGTLGTGIFVTSSTQVRANVPIGATSGPITVQNSGGPPFTTISNFTVIGTEPHITSFTPTSGTAGSVITISGVQFQANVTSVKVNGTNVAGFWVQSNIRLFATNTMNVTTGPITVTGPGGSHTTTDLFYVTPQITGFAPTNGPIGTTVAITGVNFLGATAVKFNGVGASSFVVSNNTLITASIPAGSTSGKISVEVAASGSQAISANQFLVSPTITGFAPNAGAPGTNVTIVGNNFLGNTTVRFNGTAANITSLASNQIVATVPNGATTGPISVTTTNGMAVSTNLFYLPPIITNFTPTNSLPGSNVTINGTNFLDASSVTFNGQPALAFDVAGSNQITAVVPNGVTTGPIRVTGPAGTGTSAQLFYAMPIVTGFLPDKGLPGTNVTVFGNNFQGTTSVKFNGVEAESFGNVTSNQLTTVVPAGGSTGPISVTAPAGTGTSAQNFVFDYRSDVRVNAFTDSPDPVTVASNLTLTIRPVNSGPSPATNTIVSVTLNETVTLKSATTTQGTVNTNSNPVVFNLGILNTGNQPTLNLVVIPQLHGQIINTAVIDSDLTDPDTANNNLQISTTVLPIPLLSIRHVPPDKVRLSWPSSLTNFVLQGSTNLAQSNDWMNVPGSPVLIGGERVLTNTTTGSNHFFRLRK